MKALISTTEVFDYQWVSSWIEGTEPNTWIAQYSEILNCQRVAQVEPDDKTFEVYHALIWVDCPDDCVQDQWYFKDGQCLKKPSDVPQPSNPNIPPIETLP